MSSSLPLTKKLINENEIRVFSDAKIQASIDRVLASLPENAAGAVVAHADLNGATLSIVGRVGDHWTVVASGYRTWSGQMNAEADIRYAW